MNPRPSKACKRCSEIRQPQPRRKSPITDIDTFLPILLSVSCTQCAVKFHNSSLLWKCIKRLICMYFYHCVFDTLNFGWVQQQLLSLTLTTWHFQVPSYGIVTKWLYSASHPWFLIWIRLHLASQSWHFNHVNGAFYPSAISDLAYIATLVRLTGKLPT